MPPINTAMALWVIEPTDIEAAIEATEVENWYMLESDDIVAVARLWNEYDSVFGIGYNFGATATGVTQIERLQKWFGDLYGADQTGWSEEKSDAWTALKAYKTFIQGLDKDEYTDAQVIAAGQPANN